MRPNRNTLVLALLFLVAVAIPFGISGYWLYIIILAYYYTIMASSWNLLSGYTGQISLAHAAFAGIGAYTSAFLTLYFSWNPFPAMIMGGLSATVVGYGLGRICLRLKGPYLALTTLAFSEIFRIIVTVEYDYTRGTQGLNTPPLFPTLSKIPYYYTIFALMLVTLYVLYRTINSPIGLYLKAIREDEDAAAVMGVNIVKWKVFAFTASSFFAGLAGGFFAGFIRVVSPQMILLGEMGLIIAMTVIGGLGTLTGPILGAIVVEVFSEYVKDFGPYELIIFGALLILMMRFSREGLHGFLRTHLLRRLGLLKTDSSL